MEDLKAQEQHGVNYIRYWVDEAAGKVFCLVEAPDAEAAHSVHREAHGPRRPGDLPTAGGVLAAPRSLRFYEETLGLAVYREWGRGRERGVVFVLGGGLLEVSGTSVESASGAVRLFLQVRDLRAMPERLAARGVPVEEEPTVRPWGLFEMVACDPDGLALLFVEVPPDHSLRRCG